jgi:hypothetical protein
MIVHDDFERSVQGSWSVHSSRSFFGKEYFRRRPKRHIVFEGSEWRLYETGWRWRLKNAATSQGRWQILDLDARALLVLTVLSYRQSDWTQAGALLNNMNAGGYIRATAVEATRSLEALKMRSGEAHMYFLLVRLQSQELIIALPSNGWRAPQQRWVRARMPAAG